MLIGVVFNVSYARSIENRLKHTKTLVWSFNLHNWLRQVLKAANTCVSKSEKNG